MSVQQQCPSDLPDRVLVTVFGTEIVADVVDTELDATAGHVRDILTVEHEGSRLRVDADNAVPAPR